MQASMVFLKERKNHDSRFLHANLKKVAAQQQLNATKCLFGALAHNARHLFQAVKRAAVEHRHLKMKIQFKCPMKISFRLLANECMRMHTSSITSVCVRSHRSRAFCESARAIWSGV